MQESISIEEFDYHLPSERIAKFPLAERSDSKLLHYHNGTIADRKFSDIGSLLPEGSLLVFNNTRVIRARLEMRKQSGARLEIFCLEPHAPADYERAFAARGESEWCCIVGNLKRWKSGDLQSKFIHAGREHELTATMVERGEREHIIRFRWSAPLTFGEVLEELGRIPIPPYLCRESEALDTVRYQNVYSKYEGSVAAPTAGLHFTPELIASLAERSITTEELTLHVGAGTFLPVKCDNATEHEMHTEHFEVRLGLLRSLLAHLGAVTAVGTTSVRTIESLTALAYRLKQSGTPDLARPVSQWELYSIEADFGAEEALNLLISYMEQEEIESIKAATQIMITPLGYRFKIVKYIVTNFHQPKSTLLLLVSAYVGEDWKRIYDHALGSDYRFLSYGDSSLLMVDL
ncbi:MAG: S-adenosylmethionine:tRNA ribosyltransferase-isomerase [Rikenellaceae bacterium]